MSRKPLTLAGSLAEAFESLASEAVLPRWPSPTYANRPVDFVRDLLRVRDPATQELVPAQLLPEQERILQGLAVPNARVSVASGHKCGKDFIASCAAVWFLCSFPGARVQITAPSERQVNGITWREVRMRVRQARVPLCRPGEMGDQARTGIVCEDLREIKGFTAREAENVAGISGAAVLYIVTEASGVADPIFEAIIGNLAGDDARLLLISNPTKTSGFFYDTHHKEKAQWDPIELSSWQIVEAQERDGRRIPGTASRRWCEERLKAWGKDDPRYKVRVLGKFVELGEDLVVPFELVDAAQKAWEAAPLRVPETRILPSDVLHVGLDPAGGGRDETALALRRGRKILCVRRWREEDPDRNAELVMQAVLAELAPLETGCVIKVDKGGEGWRLVAALRHVAGRVDRRGSRIRVVPIDFGWHPRHPASYLRLRDELWFTLRFWLKDGGAIPQDDKLEEELISPRFTEDLKHRLVVESKEHLRKRLGRSTDSADAVILAVWPHGDNRDHQVAPRRTEARDDDDAGEPAVHIDPYKGLEAFGR